jgi:hypothetical protein
MTNGYHTERHLLMGLPLQLLILYLQQRKPFKRQHKAYRSLNLPCQSRNLENEQSLAILNSSPPSLLIETHTYRYRCILRQRIIADDR